MRRWPWCHLLWNWFSVTLGWLCGGKWLCGWLQPLVGGGDGSDRGLQGPLGELQKGLVLQWWSPGIRRWSRAPSGRRFQGECRGKSCLLVKQGWGGGGGVIADWAADSCKSHLKLICRVGTLGGGWLGSSSFILFFFSPESILGAWGGRKMPPPQAFSVCWAFSLMLTGEGGYWDGEWVPYIKPFSGHKIECLVLGFIFLWMSKSVFPPAFPDLCGHPKSTLSHYLLPQK